VIVLLSGQIKNIGDFLITERARLLFEKYVDNEIVILDRTKNLEPNLELINSSRLLVLCGGPAYTADLYQGIYPLVDDITKIKVPIIPFGLGWCGRPAGRPMEFKFENKTQKFLTNVHEKIESSSCRCDITKLVLNNNGFQNVTMTGCPVWYDLPSIGKEFEEKKNIEHIVFTTAADPKLIGQTWRLIKMVKGHFPKAKVTMAYHRGIMPDKYTTIRATTGYLLMALGAKIINRRIRIKDVAYDLRRLDFYDHCDLHIGYRVHAHLYFLSKRLPSILINEDGRGKGMVETMNLPVFNIEDKDLVENIEKEIENYKQSNFSAFNQVGHYIDNHFKVMKEFLQGLIQE
jgi:hypothetical protein